MAHTYEYALIRLMPFEHRGESINVGLVVFHDDKIDVRLEAPTSLLRYFNVNSRSVDWIATHLKEVDDSSLDIEARLIGLSKTPGFSLSEAGWFMTDENSQYEQRISDVINEYISRPKTSKIPQKRSSINRKLKSVFKEYEIFSQNVKDIENHKIIPNMPVGPSGKLHVDFMLKNGSYHATETLDFSNSDNAGSKELKNAALASVTLQHAKDNLSNIGINCYLVYMAPAVIENAVQPALKIAQRDISDSFNLESKDDKNDIWT